MEYIAYMAKNKLNKAWVQRHIKDPYVILANKDGYRSRAAYKLSELATEHDLFKSVKVVLDLGCAPGSWSQVAIKQLAALNQGAKVIGVDLLAVEPLAGLDFIQGDFTSEETLLKLIERLNGKKVDLVISDLAPEFSGIKSVDQLRSASLVELALDFCNEYLVKDGNLVVKMFQSGEFTKLVTQSRQMFAQVLIKKPAASRADSAEVYLVCKHKR
jgi:23S rRNA (uridine2552-2'-O)-methyltransferase